MKFTSVVAVLVLLAGSMAQAAIITASYINIQTASNLTFTSNVVNYGNTPPSNIPLPVGSFLRFAVALTATNNPNSVAGGAWDQGNQLFLGNPAQPSQLGIQVFNMEVNSTDPAGVDVAAQGTAGTGRTLSRIQFNTAFQWALTDAGDVGATVGSSGQIGKIFLIDAGNAFANQNTATGVAQLAYFTSSAPAGTGAGSEIYHSTLGMFKANTTNPVFLSPNIPLNQVNVWEVLHDGTVDGDGIPVTDAQYGGRTLSAGAGDSIVQLPQLPINVPEPASMGLLALGLLGLVARRRSN